MTHQSDITDKKKRSVANIRENIFTSFCLKNIVEHNCYVVTKCIICGVAFDKIISIFRNIFNSDKIAVVCRVFSSHDRCIQRNNFTVIRTVRPGQSRFHVEFQIILCSVIFKFSCSSNYRISAALHLEYLIKSEFKVGNKNT